MDVKNAVHHLPVRATRRDAVKSLPLWQTISGEVSARSPILTWGDQRTKLPQACRQQHSRLHLVELFFSGTGPSYDAMVHYATLGIDRRWKRQIVAQVPSASRRILDLASGTGILTRALAERFPSADVVGVELREEYLAVARDKPLPNVSFHLGRAEDYSSDTPFDCVVSSYLAKYADLPRLAAAAASWLTPGAAFSRTTLRCHPVPYSVRSGVSISTYCRLSVHR